MYVDAYKGNASMITEIVYYEKQESTEAVKESEETSVQPVSRLVSPFHDNMTRINDITLRPAAAVARDIDGGRDGVLEMPLMIPLPGYETAADAEKLYLTTWRNYDGKRFNNVFSAVMDYEDEYYFKYPRQWIVDNTTNVTMGADSRQRIFYIWDPVNKIRGDELLTLQTVSEKVWDEREEGQWDGYIELGHRAGMYYVGKITATTGVYALTEETLRECFASLDS